MRARSSEQEDYLLRIIRQAAEALRRLREMLTGSAEAGEAVRRDAGIAIEQLLGEVSPLLARVDADTAVRLVGSQTRIALWADLLELEADACERAGDASEASTHRARAAALRTAAVKLAGGAEPRLGDGAT
jgi:hypothetical protein